VNKIIPSLMIKFKESKKEQEVEIFTGLKGLEIVFREQIEMMKADETNYVIGGTKGVDEGALMAFFKKIHTLRAEKKIKTKMLYNKQQKEMVEEQYSNYKYTTVRYIEHTSPVAINIYKDRVAIVIFGQEINTMMITSQEVADSFLEYFKMMWKE